MPSRVNQCLNGLSQPRNYSREQWFALFLSLLCFFADLWAIVLTIQESNRPSGRLHHDASSLRVALWSLEGLLGLAFLSLLLFAFSAPPPAPPSPDRLP